MKANILMPTVSKKFSTEAELINNIDSLQDLHSTALRAIRNRPEFPNRIWPSIFQRALLRDSGLRY